MGAEEDPSFWSGNGVKRFEDIDVGLKSLSSYTVSGLAPGVEYVFELCLKKGNFVIGITSAVYRTKRQGFEADAGIQVWSITKKPCLLLFLPATLMSRAQDTNLLTQTFLVGEKKSLIVKSYQDRIEHETRLPGSRPTGQPYWQSH